MLINEKRVIKLMGVIIIFQLFYNLFYYSNIQTPVIIKPLIATLFWLGVAIYIWYLDRQRAKSKLRFRSFIMLWVFISACLYLFSYFAAGYIDGFGKTPYDTTIIGIIKNLLLYGTILFFKEWIRNFLINAVQKKYALYFGVVIVFLYTFISINWNTIFQLKSLKEYIIFFSSKVFVALALNIFLTYISYLSGPITTTIYILVSQIPLWIMSPIPNLTWFTASVLGIVFPMLSLYVITNIYNQQSKIIKPRVYRGSKPYSWILVAVLSVLMVWFAVGFFRFHLPWW